MRTDIIVNIVDILTFLGVFQGLFLAFFFLKNSSWKKNKANLYQGLLILALSIIIAEQFLNNTRLILKVIHLSNFSEPLNLILGPLFYLYIKHSRSDSHNRKDFLHFVLFLSYLCYSTFYFIQPDSLKYNSYVYSYQPDWTLLNYSPKISEDPLSIGRYINEISAIHFSAYLLLSFILLKSHRYRTTLRNNENEKKRKLYSSLFHMSILLVIFIFVKMYYGRDIGDYFLSAYISIVIYITSYRVVSSSSFFSENESFLDIISRKYSKSSLTELEKIEIEKKILFEMEVNKFYKESTASLQVLSKRIHIKPHNISQVLNEKMKNSFFELISYYRVEEAKQIFREDRNNNYTIEIISEMVGYNSKTAFVNAFKKYTNKTPSEYRKIEL